MASSAADRMGGMFGVGTVATGVRPAPRLVLPDAVPAGEVAGVHGSAGSALARDVAGAALVLGSTAALWAWFLAAAL